ncbi:hypothetical protein [Stenotrophomonas phage RAS14]
MKHYYITDADIKETPSYHGIGFDNRFPSYLYSPVGRHDAKIHLLNYDFNNIPSWYHTTNNAKVTLVIYNL